MRQVKPVIDRYLNLVICAHTNLGLLMAKVLSNEVTGDEGEPLTDRQLYDLKT
jgi:hypothetical protein